MKVGDLVRMSNAFHGEHHGILLKINKRCGDLSGNILVQWVGIFNDRLGYCDPREVEVLNKNKINT